MAYLSLAEFKLLTLIPESFVDKVETQQAGFIEGQCSLWSARIDARLRKRYAVPFATPYPETVQLWLVSLVTMSVWLRRGFAPTDEQAQVFTDNYKTTLDELKEAADGNTGLFDLPLRADTVVNGIVPSGTLVSSAASPYAWTTAQRLRARDEDTNGGSTVF